MGEPAYQIEDLTPAREAAVDIATRVLDQTGRATMQGDFVAYKTLFDLPQVVRTFDGTKTLETTEDLYQVFRDIRTRFASLGVTDLVRRVIAAEFQDASTIMTTHETRLMNGTQLLQDTFPTHSILRCRDGVWTVGTATYAVDNEHAMYKSLSDKYAFDDSIAQGAKADEASDK